MITTVNLQLEVAQLISQHGSPQVAHANVEKTLPIPIQLFIMVGTLHHVHISARVQMPFTQILSLL